MTFSGPVINQSACGIYLSHIIKIHSDLTHVKDLPLCFVLGIEQSLNEKLLFHGTSRTPPSKIWQSEDGFDLRYSRRGMWGIGSYFAEKASYSDQYAYTYNTNYVQFCEMLVANVLTGNSKQMPSDRNSRNLTRPPVYVEATVSNPEVLYDSVTGHTNGSRIYVLYKLDMAYPSYLVRYFKL